jgi:hypothetical protein
MRAMCLPSVAASSGVLNSACPVAASSEVPIDESRTIFLQSLRMQATRKRLAQAEPTHGHEQSALLLPNGHPCLPSVWDVPMSACPEENLMPARADQHLCPEANSTGLEHARTSRRRTPTLEILQRRARLLGHLLTLASDGCPVSVRTLYELYRSSVGASPSDCGGNRLAQIQNCLTDIV